MTALNVAADRRRIRQEHTRERILAKARQALLQHGAADFSLRQLAAELGYTPGALYLYFTDKNELLGALVDDAFAHLLIKLREVPRGRTAIDTLRQTLATYVAFGLEYPDEYRFAFVHPRAASDRPLVPHAAFELLRELAGECARVRGFQHLDVESASQILWTSTHGITSALIALPQFPWLDRERLIAEQIETTIAGLRARRPAVKEPHVRDRKRVPVRRRIRR